MLWKRTTDTNERPAILRPTELPLATLAAYPSRQACAGFYSDPSAARLLASAAAGKHLLSFWPAPEMSAEAAAEAAEAVGDEAVAAATEAAAKAAAEAAGTTYMSLEQALATSQLPTRSSLQLGGLGPSFGPPAAGLQRALAVPLPLPPPHGPALILLAHAIDDAAASFASPAPSPYSVDEEMAVQTLALSAASIYPNSADPPAAAVALPTAAQRPPVVGAPFATPCTHVPPPIAPPIALHPHLYQTEPLAPAPAYGTLKDTLPLSPERRSPTRFSPAQFHGPAPFVKPLAAATFLAASPRSLFSPHDELVWQTHLLPSSHPQPPSSQPPTSRPRQPPGQSPGQGCQGRAAPQSSPTPDRQPLSPPPRPTVECVKTSETAVQTETIQIRSSWAEETHRITSCGLQSTTASPPRTPGKGVSHPILNASSPAFSAAQPAVAQPVQPGVAWARSHLLAGRDSLNESAFSSARGRISVAGSPAPVSRTGTPRSPQR